MYNARFVLRWSIALFVIAVAGLIVLPVTAQCAARTDWPSYTVARGDTLFSIARRSNTSVSALMQANCLSNANRLLVGQQIRVPSAGSVSPTDTTLSGEIPTSERFSYQVAATFQQFDNGFMTWHAASGVIWVFYNSGRVASYPLARYGGLAMARYFATLPPGRQYPNYGFRLVYDNFPDVRANIGLAIGGERGYDMLVQSPAFGNFFVISLPDERRVRINSDGTWTFSEALPVVTPTLSPNQYTTGATFQSFGRGFMVWRADTGDIMVYVGHDTGELFTYRHGEYGQLPIRTDFPYPQVRGPAIMPGNGFNRVWSNIPGLRDRIGWAINSEFGYTLMVIREGSRMTGFGVPDGRFVTHSSGNLWTVTSGSAR
jgi:murein DD-endopeptidase MepM/ murein hydrolase activator NlpD